MGTYEVSVQGWFAAAHQLRLGDGTLEPLHGHNWHVRVTFAGPALDGMDVLADFTQIKPALDRVLATLHDRNLNDLPPFQRRNPSAEVVAAHVAASLDVRLPAKVRLAVVEVEESPGCVARYRPD